MFEKACSKIHECVYGITASSVMGPNLLNFSTGTAFMIVPGILATAAHGVHVENNPSKPAHSQFEAIRSPDIGKQMETADLIAEDPIHDIALLRIKNPRSQTIVSLHTGVVATGAACGSLGFPLAQVSFGATGKMFNLVERFQGANVSAYMPMPHATGRSLHFYETDSFMYSGSSGCPGFLVSGDVFAMHVASIIEPSQPQPAQVPGAQASGAPATRLAIALWVPSADIAEFARTSKVNIK